MQRFFKRPQAPESYLSAPTNFYFSKYEENYYGDLILISGKLRVSHKGLSDAELWKVCFGGLRLDRFEVTRHGLRVEIVAKMRDIKEIRKDIEEDKKKGIRI